MVLLFQVFYVAIINLLLVPLNCSWITRANRCVELGNASESGRIVPSWLCYCIKFRPCCLSATLLERPNSGVPCIYRRVSGVSTHHSCCCGGVGAGIHNLWWPCCCAGGDEQQPSIPAVCGTGTLTSGIQVMRAHYHRGVGHQPVLR